MEQATLYRHQPRWLLTFFTVLLTAMLIFLFIFVAEAAFQRISITRVQLSFVLIGTVVAVNLRGAIIPSVVSIYLLSRTRKYCPMP
jgi:uncharacterized membrane protein